MNIHLLVRRNIRALKPYTAARHLVQEGILLDANENSFGSVLNRCPLPIAHCPFNRYPDPYHYKLRAALSDYHGIPQEHFFVGVGSDEIIDLLIRIFCDPERDKIATLEPTYGMYSVSAAIHNIPVILIPLNKKWDIDEAQTFTILKKEKPKLLFCCSPNNPTGNKLNSQTILSIARKFNGIVIVDEAYQEFASYHQPSLIRNPLRQKNLVVLRTFSKAWGLAALRVGYAVAAREVIEYLYKVKAPYNLNTLSSILALSALKQKQKMHQGIRAILQERTRLIQELGKIKAIETIYPSDANFILIKIPMARSLYNALVQQGVIVRVISKIPDTLRLTVGTPRQNKKLLQLLKKYS